VEVSQTRKFARLLVALWVLLLAACATSPYQGEGKTRSDVLLQAQFEQARQRSMAKPEGRLIFAGVAMQSKAFRNDVLLAEKAVLAIDPNAIVFKLSNSMRF
jgi:starvation-inducible outer membrane lipoprotein